MSALSATRNHAILSGAILLFLSASVSAVERQPTLSSLRAQYEESLDKLEEITKKRRQTWQREYYKLLGVLERQARTAGALDSLIVVQKEIARFNETREIPEEAILSEPEGLRALQLKYQHRPEECALARNRAIQTLFERYNVCLNALQKKLTISNDIDAAMEVKNEREQAAADPRVTAAQFEIAAFEAEQSEASQKTVVPAPEADAADVISEEVPIVNEIPSVADPVERAPDVLIYADGKRPPTDPRFDFKKTNLIRTDHAPLKSEINMKLSMACDSQTSKQGNRWYKRRKSNNKHVARVYIKTLPAAGETADIKVIVQYFAKSARPAGRVVPILHGLRKVSLPELGTRPVCLDFAGVDTSMTKEKRGGSAWTSSGNELYGIIVSVFDSDGALLCQGTTARGLNAYAPGTMSDTVDFERFEEARRELDNATVVRNAAREALARKSNDAALNRAYSEAELARRLAEQKLIKIR